MAERSAEEGRLLAESEDLVTELQGRSRRREGLKRRQEEASPGCGRAGRGRGRAGAGSRPASASRQVCDDPEELRRKVRELASAVRNAKHLVVYTGAGISTVRGQGRDGRAPGRLPGCAKHGPPGAGVGRPLLGVGPQHRAPSSVKQQYRFAKARLKSTS